MTPKKIAVLGGGNGAHTMAAEFALKGHTVKDRGVCLTRADRGKVALQGNDCLAHSLFKFFRVQFHIHSLFL